ncbi:MAG: hypothetical protein COT73_09850 [Bdellovibrio sp. CG10_big_fil_rev_8_21_14_0_10_47_8]|nr:MAG: hypothetical protein COT73_09850 [Bdellovibrio sp. CG10_big_fil_rev_8_21_14_0_10_47_8]
MSSQPIPSGVSQLELAIERSREKDRNFHLGGRSFYFFDFDDNVAFLSTPLVLFHKQSGEEKMVSSGQWALEHVRIGKTGIYKDFEIRWEDQTGTFRHFRDHDEEQLRKLGFSTQTFLQDVAEALGFPDLQWKGPSWQCFYHATFNQRPVSVITARGHEAETIKGGVRLLVGSGHLPMEPNYLSIFPVSNPEIRKFLGDAELNENTAELKQRAIRASVEMALRTYGYSAHHRFGMSDDDPRNIQLIIEEMTRLKATYPEMSFFMIETHKGDFVKHEITLSGLKGSRVPSSDTSQQSLSETQIRLF